MSVLSGPEIVRCVTNFKEGKRTWGPRGAPYAVDVDPFDPDQAGPNSYDLRLGPDLIRYVLWPTGASPIPGTYLDPKEDNPTVPCVPNPDGSFFLEPGVLYLGSTVERTYCENLIPWVDGRSSVGRLGVQVHMTAGRGDDGFNGRWTLEITCVHPVRLYPGMRIAQVTFFTLEGERKPYSGRYGNQGGPTPSRLWHDKGDL